MKRTKDRWTLPKVFPGSDPGTEPVAKYLWDWDSDIVSHPAPAKIDRSGIQGTRHPEEDSKRFEVFPKLITGLQNVSALVVMGVWGAFQRWRSQTQAAEFPLKGGRARSQKQIEELGYPRCIQSRAAAPPCWGASWGWGSGIRMHPGCLGRGAFWHEKNTLRQDQDKLFLLWARSTFFFFFPAGGTGGFFPACKSILCCLQHACTHSLLSFPFPTAVVAKLSLFCQQRFFWYALKSTYGYFCTLFITRAHLIFF